MSEVKNKYGAWKKQTPKGEVINFTIEGKKYSMWVNSFKKADNQPDYQIYEDNYKPKESQPIVNDDLEF
jgi:hypothetical protein